MEFADEYNTDEDIEESTKSGETEESKTSNVDEEKTIIIDIGQGSTKIGYAGDTLPKVFPTIIGKPKYQQRMAGVESQELYVGDDTISMRGVLKLEYPINRGQVMDWNHYYAILNHIFYNSLRVDPKNCNIIYIVPPLTPPDAAIYFARVLFETHQCKSVAIIDSATTSVFSVGETTGLNVELGEGLTTITPVMDGRLYEPSIQRMNLAGVDILTYLQSLLSRYGIMHKREIIKEIKEKSCKIAIEPNSASQDPANDMEYILPDGESLKINAYVATWAGEVLFQPGLLGLTTSVNLPQAIINSIRSTHQAYWRKLLRTIIFSGGTSNFNGLKERLEKELEELIPQLGPLPEPEQKSGNSVNKDSVTDGPVKMVQINTSSKEIENCIKCGELIDINSKFCQNCGAKIEHEQLNILGMAKQQYPKHCPKCNEELDGNSQFCGFCGEKLEPIIIDKDKIKRKDKKIIKKGEVDEDEFSKILEEVEDEYGGVEELQEIDKEFEQEQENKLIRIIISEEQTFASFKGASIIGSLPKFKQFMVTYQQYQENPNSVMVDFSQIVSEL